MGRGNDVATYEFADLNECRRRQAEIEQSVLAAGYQLAQVSSERRREQGYGTGPIIAEPSRWSPAPPRKMRCRNAVLVQARRNCVQFPCTGSLF